MGGAQTAMQAQQMRNMSRGNNNRGGGNRGGGGGNGGDGGGDGGAEEQEELLEGEADEEGGEKKTEMHNDDDDAAIRKSKWHIEEGKFPIQQTKVWLFILDDPQWFIMFIFSQILFWVRYMHATLLIDAVLHRPRRAALLIRPTPHTPRDATLTSPRYKITGLGLAHIRRVRIRRLRERHADERR